MTQATNWLKTSILPPATHTLKVYPSLPTKGSMRHSCMNFHIIIITSVSGARSKLKFLSTRISASLMVKTANLAAGHTRGPKEKGTKLNG